MDAAWKAEFSRRMRSFESKHSPKDGWQSISIKVRVISGCFHREHSPHAYQLIERHLASLKPNGEFSYVEHESGPEVLAWIALATAGATLSKSIIDLVTAMIKARSEGITKGDTPAEPVELIVRKMSAGDSFVEETVLKIGHKDNCSPAQIETLIRHAVDRLLAEEKRVARDNKKKGRNAP